MACERADEPPPPRCELQDPDWTLDLKHLCGTGRKESGRPPNLYIKYESFTQGAMNKNTKPLPVPTLDWRGVQWTTHTQHSLPLSDSEPLPREVGAGPLHLRPTWNEWWPHRLVAHELPMFTKDSFFVHKLRTSPAVNASRCVVVEETFLSVDWSQHPEAMFTNATAVVVGSPAIMRQVRGRGRRVGVAANRLFTPSPPCHRSRSGRPRTASSPAATSPRTCA